MFGRNENNQAIIRGEIASRFVFSHEFYGIRFYEVFVKVRRRSDAVDLLPVLVSDEQVDVTADHIGDFITVNGQYRSRNRHDGQKRRLILYVYAKKVGFTGAELDADKMNHVMLDGFIVQVPVFRRTLLGKEITDIILAVNRSYGHTDYIPCILWGKDAEEAADWEVGKHVQITGKIQSRIYTKKMTETESEERVAYEVSVKKWDTREGVKGHEDMDITLEEYIEGEKKREQRKW